MKFQIIVLAVFALIILGLGCFLAAKSKSSALSSADLQEKIKAKALDFFLVDVRTPGEFSGGHIPTAVNIPVDHIAGTLPTENKAAYIVVYCRSGNRSAQAQKILADKGFTNVVNFGGVGNWKGDLLKGDF